VEFDELVREHQAMVYSVAYHFFRDRALAEDLAQEVFLRLHGAAADLESAAHARFWLRKAISRLCIDESRRRRFRRRLELSEVPEPSAQPERGDVFLSATLRSLISTLPEGARLAMILRYQEDLEPGEIAVILNLPVSTVKSHLYRSLAVLRVKLSRINQKVRA
jgi:RNA polymerase sigma-70 factor (ECF subfamily)